LQEEFPILTIRRTYWKSALDELLWIWQKKSNKVQDLSSHVWDSWADETGSIGKAYGYQLAKKSIYPEGEFDQVDRVIYDLKNNPASRRIMTNIYNFEDLHEMGLYPCAYSMTFNVSGKTLNAILNQRSQDMLAANNWNVVQYSLLTMMMAQVAGLEAGELIHVIADAHIYDRHVPMVEEMIAREPKQAPALIVDKSVKDFYEFTKDHFRLEGYEFHEFDEKIPVAI
jgi:thymidylate synthase